MRKEEFVLEGKQCIVYSEGTPEFILVQPANEFEVQAMDHEVQAIADGTDVPLMFAAFQVSDWDRELSPWAAPPVFGKDAFGDGAAATLSYIEDVFIPELLRRYDLSEDIPLIIGGYSLAGLFSLWSIYQTNTFSGAAASSPSVWFPGWTDFAGEHAPLSDCVYLSLGNKEEKARNPVMATVGDCIRKQYGILSEGGVPCTLEWNEGNHFREPEIRTAKGFIWCISELKREQDESLAKYDNKKVRVKAEGDLELTGFASYCPPGYGLVEFDREEESISIAACWGVISGQTEAGQSASDSGQSELAGQSASDSGQPITEPDFDSYQIFQSDIISIEILENEIDDYIRDQKPEIRKTLDSVRAVIGDCIPDAEECIRYKMPTWRRKHNLIHFAAQKHHIGLYPGPDAIEHFADILDRNGYKYSKGAIQIPYDKVELDLICMIAEYCGKNE